MSGHTQGCHPGFRQTFATWPLSRPRIACAGRSPQSGTRVPTNVALRRMALFWVIEAEPVPTPSAVSPETLPKWCLLRGWQRVGGMLRDPDEPRGTRLRLRQLLLEDITGEGGNSLPGRLRKAAGRRAIRKCSANDCPYTEKDRVPLSNQTPPQLAAPPVGPLLFLIGWQVLCGQPKEGMITCLTIEG